MEEKCIISFRSSLQDQPISSLLLEPRSLLVFEGEAYNSYLHSIDACVEETTCGRNCFNLESSANGERGMEGEESVIIRREKERISLTIRFVPPTKKEEEEERKKE